ncbi:MAG: OmpH family outer membrane protein [Henriciella sp.]|nr:OmpH family outer membrane protein [Hyphomonadaceae bacterium]
MFRLKSLFAAFALIVATPLALAPAAAAQGTTAVVIDRNQIFAQSKAGQDIITKIQGIEAAMQGELKPTADQLAAEGPALEAKTTGKTREAILADAALKAEVEAYARKAGEFNRKRQITAQELALTERQALVDFNTALVPVLREVVAERGANVILDKSQVVFVDDATDVTASVVAKLDASTPTINVVRQRVPTQPAQQ